MKLSLEVIQVRGNECKVMEWIWVIFPKETQWDLIRSFKKVKVITDRDCYIQSLNSDWILD